jgi:Holliday junction resolvase
MSMTNYRRGVEKERECMRILEAAGYETARTAGSHGLFDVIAINHLGVRLIQLKRSKDGKWGQDYELAKEKLLQLPKIPNITREIWIWVDRQGWVKQEVI